VKTSLFSLTTVIFLIAGLVLPIEMPTMVGHSADSFRDCFHGPHGLGPSCSVYWLDLPAALIFALPAVVAALCQLLPRTRAVRGVIACLGLICGAIAILFALPHIEVVPGGEGIWFVVAGLLLLAWRALASLSQQAFASAASSIVVPALFGLLLIFLWELIVRAFAVPQILLPAPSQIGYQLLTQAGMLWEDFRQTFLKSVLAGFVMGCGLGFVVAVLTDRVPFLQRGMLPLGNLVSAVPIVGIAPIMVMWFGFGWESKAAVIVVMTFFPMLINTIAGLNASDHMERDLMRSYGSSYWQTFFMLRLPAALPFVFNALKINSTLALIGAIVAEMFGSPISGMGFRISTEVYKMNVDIVWATIAVAAVAGSAFYGLLALIERRLTFWHPSYRSRHTAG